MTPRTVLIAQARVGSTRLPGKVLMEVWPGRSLLDLTIERLKGARMVDEIVIAIPEGAANDQVARESEAAGVSVFRGSEEDVLGRYRAAAREFGAELVVRVTADNPLLDPVTIDLHVDRMQRCYRQADFVTNMMQQSFPYGVAVEVMPVDTLERMHRLSNTAYLREHVTTLAYEHPEWFSIEMVLDDSDRSSMRWTVDYQQDLEFVQAVFAALYAPGRIFDKYEILGFLAQHPEVANINAHVCQ